MMNLLVRTTRALAKAALPLAAAAALYAQCQQSGTDLALPNPNCPATSYSSGISTIHGTNSITAGGSGGNLTVSGAASVNLQAGSQITLLPGFTAIAGGASTFHAFLASGSSTSGHPSIFTDVSSTSPYYNAVTTMYQLGVTAGCGQGNFCPTDYLQREDIAVFIVRSWSIRMWNDPEAFKSYVGYNKTPYFNDVAAADPRFAYVQKLYELGITAGFTAPQINSNGTLGAPGVFCPNTADNGIGNPVCAGQGTVQNYQAAIFVDRARALSDNFCEAPYYGTVPKPFPTSTSSSCAPDNYTWSSWLAAQAAGQSYFTDVPATDTYFKFVEAFADTRALYPQAPNSAPVCCFNKTNTITRGTMAIWTVAGMALAGLPTSFSIGGGGSTSHGGQTPQTWTFTYRDPNGAGVLQSGQVELIDGGGNVRCNFAWNRPTGLSVYTGIAASTSTLGTTLNDGFCGVSLISIANSGTDPTAVAVTFNVGFLQNFPRAYTIQTEVNDINGLASSWEQVGTFTVDPAPNGIGPASIPNWISQGAIGSQTFTVAVADPNGNYTNVSRVQVVFNISSSMVDACFLDYDPQTDDLSIADQSGSLTTFTNFQLKSGSGTLGDLTNTNCQVVGAGSSVSGSGASLQLNLQIVFRAGFVGPLTTFLRVDSAAAGQYQRAGTWTAYSAIPGGPGATPPTGINSDGTFTINFSDANGYGYVTTEYIALGTSLTDTLNTCRILYTRGTGSQNHQLQVFGTSFDPTASEMPAPVAVGSPGASLSYNNGSNAVCTVDFGKSSYTESGTSGQLKLWVGFPTQTSVNAYVRAIDRAGGDSGWNTQPNITNYGFTVTQNTTGWSGNVQAGQNTAAAYTITTNGGFNLANSPVTFTCSSNSSNVTITCPSSVTSSTVTLSITTTKSTVAYTATLTVTASSGSGSGTITETLPPLILNVSANQPQDYQTSSPTPAIIYLKPNAWYDTETSTVNLAGFLRL